MKKDGIDGVDVFRRTRVVVALVPLAKRVPRLLGLFDPAKQVYQSVIVDPCISHSIYSIQDHQEERMGSP